MTNEQLVDQIKAGKDVSKNMTQLYNQNKKFIRLIARRYNGVGELEDMEQEGFLALYDAIDHYEADQGVKFLSYAEYWIRQRMQRYLQVNGSCLRLPVNRQEAISRYKRFCSFFRLEHGREPSEAEISCELRLSVDQVRKVQQDDYMNHVRRLDAPVQDEEGAEGATLGELSVSGNDFENDVIDRMNEEQFRAVLWGLVDELEGKQPEVIRGIYINGNTLAEIGRQIGRSPEAVRQIQAKALRCLRHPVRNRRVRQFFPELENFYEKKILQAKSDRLRARMRVGFMPAEAKKIKDFTEH